MSGKKLTEPLFIPSQDDPSFRWAAILLLILIEFSLYFASLFHGLVADDYVFAAIHRLPLAFYWTHPSDSVGHWRPVSFAIKYLLFGWFGESPFPWHLVNIILHCSSVMLFFSIALSLSKFLGRKGVVVALFSAVLFQVHSASIQNVYWASGIYDLLCELFLLLTAAFALRVIVTERKNVLLIVGTVTAFGCALLSKESALAFVVTLPCLFVLVSPQAPLVDRLKWVWQRGRQVLVPLWILGVLFLVSYAAIGGDSGWSRIMASALSDVVIRGAAMIVVPTDALSVSSFGQGSPIVPVLISLVYAGFCAFLLWKKYFDLGSWAAVVIIVLSSFGPFVVGGYISLRLIYSGISFLILAILILLLNNHAWKESDIGRTVIKGFLFVYFLATVLFSFSSVLDWHVADKFGTALRHGFEDLRDQVPRGSYTFAAIPARLRQASILGEPGTDFRGQMRQDGIDTTLDLRALLRIVLLSRDEESANVRISNITAHSVVLETFSKNQFFLPGDVNGPAELPVGSIFLEGSYTLRVLQTALNDRPVAVEVSSASPSDIADLVVYDDLNQRFVFLDEYVDLKAGGKNND